MYASAPAVGPTSGYLPQIFNRPQGTMTSSPDDCSRGCDRGGPLDLLGTHLGQRNEAQSGTPG
jgi:hypothetical protein